MKKVLLSLAVITACLAVLPAISASNSKEVFIKRLKICSPASYVYKTVNGVEYKRSVTGVQAGIGVVCQFEQEVTATKKIKCNFPANDLSKIAATFRNGEENKMLSDYVESKVCSIEE